MFVSSPKLFADCYALHRLLAPRHPPYALDYLNTIMQTLESALQRAPSLDTASTTIPMQIVKDDSTSRGPGAARPPHRPRAAGVDRSLRNRQQSKRFRRSPAIERGRSARSGSIKEVIQPQVPLRLPCYDFTPIIDLTLGACLLAVGTATSGEINFRGVTGGVYKARERIHRSVLICDY